MTIVDLSIILAGALVTGFFLRRMGHCVPELPAHRRASGTEPSEG